MIYPFAIIIPFTAYLLFGASKKAYVVYKHYSRLRAFNLRGIMHDNELERHRREFETHLGAAICFLMILIAEVTILIHSTNEISSSKL